jgi:hypothetical protein
VGLDLQDVAWLSEEHRMLESVRPIPKLNSETEVMIFLMASSLDGLNSKVFAGQLHTKFTVHLANHSPLELELFEVKESETSPQLELFSLTFLGPHSPQLNQQIHQFEHEKLGVFELFLTPVGVDQKGVLYEVVFHRFRKPQS